MIIATETPHLRAPQDWRHLPMPTPVVCDRMERTDLQVVETLTKWDGQGEPPVEDDR